MYFYGLDLGTLDTGVGVADENGPVTSWSLKPPSGTAGVERLAWLESALVEAMDRYPARAVLLENYAMGAKGHAYTIGEWGGVARLKLYEMGFTILMAQPQVLKKYLTGNGAAPKDVMMKELYKHYGYDTNNNNQADAVAAALVCRDVVTGVYPSQRHREACAKVVTLYEAQARPRTRKSLNPGSKCVD